MIRPRGPWLTDQLLNDSIAASDVSQQSSGEHGPNEESGESQASLGKSLDVSFGSSDPLSKSFESGSSWYLSSLIIVNAALGAGMLNFPSAFALAGGIVPGMLMHVVLALLALLSLLVMAWCSDFRGATTYHATVASFCNIFVSLSATFLLALYCYGTDISFLIIVGDQSDRLFEDHYGRDFCQHWYMDRRFIIAITSLVCVLPLCFPRKIDFLKAASTAASLGVLYLLILIVYNYYRLRGSDASGIELRTRPAAWTDVFIVVGPICFGYQCHVSAIPVYSCLRKRKLPEFLKCAVCSFSLCFIVYSIVGIFGYLTYGSHVMTDLWSSMDVKSPAFVIGLVVFMLKVLSTYPILLFCGRAALESFYLSFCCFGPRDPLFLHVWEPVRRAIMTLVWFVSSVAIGLFVTDLGAIVGLLGSLAALFIFAFPGLTLLKASLLLENNISPRLITIAYIVSILLMTLGVFLFGVVLTDSLTTPNSHRTTCYDNH